MDIKNKEKILVTGGGGFIGSAIVKELVKKGFDVYTLNRNIYPKLIELGVKYIQGDVRNKEIVERAVKGKEVVFHIAAKVGYWGLEKEFYDINVAGTKNLLNASKLNGVQKFIYTSTPSVIGYNQDVRNGDQNIPYPNSYLSAYSKTKAVAEKLVLKYNQSHFATIALRPHLVFGPGDNNLIPHLLQNIINGKLPRIGNKKIEVDLTYIDNAVAAHLCAFKALKDSNSDCAGNHTLFLIMILWNYGLG